MRRAYFITVLILLGSAVPVRATLFIEIGNGSVPQGGTGFVDVTILSDNATTGDPLGIFGYDFLISPSSVNLLEFLNPQHNTATTDPNYVFPLSTDADLSQQQSNVISLGGGREQPDRRARRPARGRPALIAGLRRVAPAGGAEAGP